MSPVGQSGGPSNGVSLLFEKGSPGRSGAYLPAPDPGKGLRDLLPAAHLRPVPPRLPEVDELGVVRHFTELSRLNFSIDGNFYPLGSCTMKYNPRINEEAAALPGFAALHPFQPEEEAQGSLELMHLLERHLAEIGGMDATTLQPAAGAQGELTGLMLIKAHHKDRGEPGRTEVLIPDSAHGTNPASCTLCGYKTVTVKSTSDGGVDLDDLKRKLGAKTAAMMITNPSTLGLFEERIEEIAAIVHGAGAQMYMDGANMNALLGRARPGDFGIDVMHFNLHKTFSTPHGGGGPGSGPVACRKHLEPYLPVPRIVRDGERFRFDSTHPKSIGRVKSFWGNHGMHVRAYAYIRHHGAEGLRQVSAGAVLNANYLLARMRGAYQIPYDRTCMHEFVLSGNRQKKQGLRTLDIAKRLLDFGFHPPTIYFPLIVPECLMIEPTETENRETLDAFADAMLRIAEECKSDPEKVHRAPHTMPVKRLDEVRAAKQPVLRWHPPPPAER